MIPHDDNVYGIFTAPHGLQPVLNAIQNAVVGTRAYIRRSHFDGAQTLHLRGASVEFDSDALEDGAQHLISGAIDGSLEQVIDAVQGLSEALAAGRIDHSFEVYDAEKQLVQRIERKAP